MYDDGEEEPAPPDEPQFNILINFIRNEDDIELVNFDFPFFDLEEMYEYNQYLFLRAAVFIPPIDENDFLESSEWQNKWFYFRISAGFPVTFYQLNGDDRVYAGSPANPDRVSQLDNKAVALPAVTLGIELQFLSFMSLEANVQLGWERLNDKHIVNTVAGAELKFPLKFVRNVTLAPYGAFTFPLHIPSSPLPLLDLPEIFFDYPRFGFGGGLEAGMKGGKSSSFFFDVNYIYYYGDAVLKNPYGPLYPEPKIIHYKRHVLGLGIGYKVGAGNRK
jgi:hypothetical protein